MSAGDHLNPNQFAKINPHASADEVRPMHHEMYPLMEKSPNPSGAPWPATVPDKTEGLRAVENSLSGLYPKFELTVPRLMRGTIPN